MQRLILFGCVLTLLGSCTTPAEETPSAPSDTISETAVQDETGALIAVIENETNCFFQRDYGCWKGHFIQSDMAFQGWNNPDGSYSAAVGWNEIDKMSGQYLKDNPVAEGGSSHPKVERRQVKVRFLTPTLAYMTWDQYNSSPDNSYYTKSLETRLMQKVGIQWKILNVTAFWDYTQKIPPGSLPGSTN